MELHRTCASPVDELAAARDSVLLDGGVAAVHALRVAALRTLVLLALARRRALRDDLRELRAHAARLRDFDVSGKRDAARRGRLLARLRSRLAMQRVDALLEALHAVPAPSPRARSRTLQELRAAAFAAGARALETGRARHLHRLRRALRRLRCAHELSDDPRPALAALQDELGRWHDLHATARAAKGGERRRLRRRETRERRRALTRWRRQGSILLLMRPADRRP